MKQFLKNKYEAPEMEVVRMVVNQAILENSNPGGAGSGSGDDNNPED